MLTVVIISQQGMIFEGTARQLIAPGEHGVFEILDFHRPMVSRLLPGHVIVDETSLPIQRGVLAVGANRVTAIVEPMR